MDSNKWKGSNTPRFNYCPRFRPQTRIILQWTGWKLPYCYLQVLLYCSWLHYLWVWWIECPSTIFSKNWCLSPQTPHYDLISAICNLLAQSPVHWKWHHVQGHQDEVKQMEEPSTLEQLLYSWMLMLNAGGQSLLKLSTYPPLQLFQERDGQYGSTNKTGVILSWNL